VPTGFRTLGAMDTGEVLAAIKTVQHEGFRVTADLVAVVLQAEVEDTHKALEALVRRGILYSSRPNAGRVRDDEVNYTFTSYISLIA